MTIEDKFWKASTQSFSGAHVTKSTLTRVTLTNCYIYDTLLLDCKLENCNVSYSMLENSILERCTVSNNCNIHLFSKLRSCYVEDSNIESITAVSSFLYGCTIEGGRLKKCMIDQVKCSRVEVEDSKLRYSDVDGKCSVKTTEINNSEIWGTPVMKQNTKSKFNHLTLRRFPAEIRAMILRYGMGGDSKQGSIMVAALRGDPTLYVEGLEILNGTCAFTIESRENPLIEHRLHPDIMTRLHHLAIE
jgi:hypothetical protein